MTGTQSHWNRVYTDKGDTAVSWHQPDPALSLQLAEHAGLGPDTRVVDIGGGAARFADALLDRGVGAIRVLDLSQVALNTARARLGARAAQVTWQVQDVTAWHPDAQVDLWHDRAVFHFLTTAAARADYIAALTRALAPGGHAIIATFAPDGPETCSGLPVVRYSSQGLADTLGPALQLRDAMHEDHHTPGGVVQRFQYSLLTRA